ncbi:hypothetical protein YC2023_058159 [Brassica napus]
MDFMEMTGVKPKTHKRIKDACRFLVSAVLGTILSAILTFFFALSLPLVFYAHFKTCSFRHCIPV